MKNNNLVKILIGISVVLAVALTAVSTRLIDLQSEKDGLPPIIENNDKPQLPNTPEMPPQEKDPQLPKIEDEIVTTKYLSKKEAIEIAVSKVGMGAKVIEVDQSLDDNPPKYEIELILGAYEYEVEIHAITGAIIDFDKDDLD